ncbi:O-antigen ligase family protein, partial [Candidatus Gracilibacteria bacterium]|nr:O-antigen ligase family protein [Candidatus Gracilibacteria bacterium]
MTLSSSTDTHFAKKASINFFDIIVRIFLVFIPFSSFVTVFLVHKIGISGASFIKEILLLLAGVVLLYAYLQSYLSDKKLKLKITKIDILILIYIFVMILVSIFTTGIQGIIYGGRYDFAFLITYLVAYHGYALLEKPISYYIYLFLISSGIMLFLSGLLKWPLTEDLLIYFGYSGNPSNWDFGGAPPIFHGIDGANVRRFQGILDNPNTMGAFVIIFSGLFAYFTRFRKEWYFVISIILIGLIGMVFYTYSRSALIGIVFAYAIVVVMSLRSLWHLYRAQLISVFLILGLLVGSVGVLYYDKAIAIVGRSGSTKGHAERMKIGFERTITHPLGQGLGSAGPAYRYVMDLKHKPVTDVVELDRFYIPESWYIQQYIEGGIIGGTIFLILMLSFFISLMLIHPILGAT